MKMIGLFSVLSGLKTRYIASKEKHNLQF